MPDSSVSLNETWAIPGLAGNTNAVGSPIVGPMRVEADPEKLALQARVRTLEYDLWCRKWVATYGGKS